ncbi:hypothetical protein Tco_0769590 [Tanacetum coccineum]|uniref:Uncharacterized protein n=1 Tax=Tanacetum coccineum TaxID=301880 RepID=A0ABQ4Z9T5_9ASTR
METKDTLSSCSNSEEQQMQQIQDKAKGSCMVSFRRFHSHLKLLSNNDLKGTRTETGFKCVFATLFGQDLETFTSTMFLNMDQLEKQLDKKEFQEIGSIAAFKVLETSVANDTSSLVPQRQKASDYDNSGPVPQLQNVSPSIDTTVPSQQELDLLFGPLYDEFFNAGTSSVNKSSSTTDNSKQQDTPPTMNIQSSTEPTAPTNVNAKENNDNQAKDTQFQQDEFINPLCTPV